MQPAIMTPVPDERHQMLSLEGVDELAVQGAAGAWCHPSTSHITMIPELAAVFAHTLNAWIEDANRFARNEEFYRGLLDQCARHIGIEAFTADDGTVMEDPCRLKIPEIVQRLATK